MKAKEIGQWGEKVVAQHLAALGYEILAENVVGRYGEIDIVAVKGSVIAFVEVKTRRSGTQYSGYQAVDREKQKRILLTAIRYLAEEELDLQPRFDVAVVSYHPNRAPHIDYLSAAFDSDALNT